MPEKSNKISALYIWIVFAVAMLFFATYWLYASNKQNLYDTAQQKHHVELESKIQGVIQERKEIALAIALSLSENQKLRDFLCHDCASENKPVVNFKSLIDQLNLHTQHGELWIQLIDAEGVSRYRSWTKKTGDSLRSVRFDVKQMLRTPEIKQGMSVGKFNLTFKSMVPLLDNNHKLLGIVEVISHLTPLVKSLENSTGVPSVLLVDKRFQTQLTKANQSFFLNDFYIANTNADEKHIHLLRHLGEQRFTDLQPIRLFENTIINQYLINDSLGRLMGYWFTFESQDSMQLGEVQVLKKQYLYASLVVLTLMLLLLAVFVLKQKADKGRAYYRNILDSASEIILVSNRLRIIDANRRFFEFYSEFENIDEFLSAYDCVCDTFIPDEGYLQRQMDDVFWLDYVFANPQKKHLAKVMKNGKVHYFEVKAAIAEKAQARTLYSIIMHDITEQELYKHQLEQLAQTDSLTGIANRLVFNRKLLEEVQRSHRYHHDLSLLVFDVDFFKNINDSYGHDVGDQVLIALCESIGASLRETDMLCRVGGEEFTVIMPDTHLKDAIQIAERIREKVESLSRESIPTRTTISLGVAQMTRWDSDKTLFRRADSALYHAKENGRNRVEVAKEDDSIQ